ncbi:hypothetical protein BU15DRAFT_76722 [Melanogaster broomeanus]|nr:hypothetical protein BU15DRAFT_76722 [Melanogaster broomeanus]
MSKQTFIPINRYHQSLRCEAGNGPTRGPEQWLKEDGIPKKGQEVQLKKRRIPKLGNPFTRKKKDGKRQARSQLHPSLLLSNNATSLWQTQSQPDREPAVQEVPTEHSVDPDTIPQESNVTDERRETQHVPTGDTIRASTPPPIASANYAKPHGITRRRDGSTSKPPTRVKTTYVAYGHMDHRVATAPVPPRKRWKGILKKKQLQAGSSMANVTGTSQQQDHRPRSPSSSSDSHVQRVDDVEASFWRVVVNVLCFCNRDGPYRDVDDDNSIVRSLLAHPFFRL